MFVASAHFETAGMPEEMEISATESRTRGMSFKSESTASTSVVLVKL